MSDFNAIPSELKLLPQWICEHVTYDPLTGKVFFKKRKLGPNATPRQKQWNTRFAGKEAGFKNGDYIRVSVLTCTLYVHQIAFACMKGYIPEEVDHKNRNKSDNVWSNLRDADRGKNSRNAGKRKRNKSKLKGVSWAKSNNCWRMDIAYKNKKYYSYHATKKEAAKAYALKSAELHGEFGCNE